MASVQKYGPLALSGACLAIALYFSMTNTAYVLEGCPSEVYPELGFLLIVVPLAVVALAFAWAAAFSGLTARLRKASCTTSMALCVTCLVLSAVAISPTGSACH